ncbi:MAG TPA: bacillithiol biosynthesis BshC [Candidatus Acidoferrales bacterium]|jgi:uncharacterized protein YllA (UPF0747 family)|nr:bacillithiol biosynthesis BshC [Candidatus Acidoferrales bacterium]
MDPDCLAPAEVPQTSRLYITYLSKPAHLHGFYAHPPNLKGIREASRELKAAATRYPAEMRFGVVQILREQNARFAGGALESQLKRNLERLESGAAAVVTGQQCGLFGGPAYTFYKAISALRVAADLTRAKIEAVPIFWMASEDHDLAEVNHVFWTASANSPGTQSRTAQSIVAQTDEPIEKVEWTEDDLTRAMNEGRSVGSVPLGKGIEALARKAADALGGAFAAEFAGALTAAYTSGETFGSAFAHLMSALFARRGLILLDPQDMRLHQLAAPLLQRAAGQQEALTAALLAQNKKLESAGYHAQVRVTESSTLLFRIEGAHSADPRAEDGRGLDGPGMAGQRVALKKTNSGFAAGDEHFSADELGKAIAAAPELFSPNALLRPVVQDFLLPTVAYIGGPAEVAYFAQNSALYKKLLRRMPAILPRPSFTIVEPEIVRLLDRYGLAPEDALLGRQWLAKKMERRHIPGKLALMFDVEQANLERMLRSLRAPLAKLDPTLKGALETAARKILYQLENLRAKAGRAADFRAGVLSRHEATVLGALFPQHGLQERSLSLLPFLARHGTDFFDELAKHSGLAPCAHRFLRL